MRVATPRVEPRRDRREPFEHDSRTASGGDGRQVGAPRWPFNSPQPALHFFSFAVGWVRT